MFVCSLEQERYVSPACPIGLGFQLRLRCWSGTTEVIVSIFPSAVGLAQPDRPVGPNCGVPAALYVAVHYVLVHGGVQQLSQRHLSHRSGSREVGLAGRSVSAGMTGIARRPRNSSVWRPVASGYLRLVGG